MKSRIPALVVTLILAATANMALARGGGGMSGGGMSMTGGVSSQHIGAQGLANGNGPTATDRDTGLGRAQDRMSDEGLKHAKSGKSQARTKAPKNPDKTADAHRRSTSEPDAQDRN